MSLRFTLKSAMLCAALSSAIVAPLPAMAENIYIMVTNTRSEDGVYRPALRVVRDGTVTYYRTDDTTAANPLTVEILRDKAALAAWLTQNAGMTAEEAGGVIVETPPAGPADTRCVGRASAKGALGAGNGHILVAGDPGDCCFIVTSLDKPKAMDDLVLVAVPRCVFIGPLPDLSVLPV